MSRPSLLVLSLGFVIAARFVVGERMGDGRFLVVYGLICVAAVALERYWEGR